MEATQKVQGVLRFLATDLQAEGFMVYQSWTILLWSWSVVKQNIKGRNLKDLVVDESCATAFCTPKETRLKAHNSVVWQCLITEDQRITVINIIHYFCTYKRSDTIRYATYEGCPYSDVSMSMKQEVTV